MPIVFNVKTAISLIFAAATHLSFDQRSPCVYASPPVQGVHAASGLPAAVSSYRYASKAPTKTKRNSYTYIMRTPTSDHHFKDKIVRIILEILRYLISRFFPTRENLMHAKNTFYSSMKPVRRPSVCSRSNALFGREYLLF